MITGAPEMLGGRVKTLHPAVHAGKLISGSPSLGCIAHTWEAMFGMHCTYLGGKVSDALHKLGRQGLGCNIAQTWETRHGMHL